MPVYDGNTKVNPSGISKIYVGDTLVYQKSPYRRLEYVSSEQYTYNSAYIRTNKTPNGATRFRVKYALNSGSHSYDRIFQAGDNSNARFQLFYGTSSNRTLYIGYYNSTPRTTTSYWDTNMHLAELRGAPNFYVDNTSIGSVTSATFTCNGPIELLNGGDRGAFARIYDFQTWQSGSDLDLHLIPCQRKSDNVVGMYDVINGVFYESQGSIGLVAGPVVDENWDLTA